MKFVVIHCARSDVPAQQRDLPVEKLPRLIGGEAAEIQNRMRAWAIEIRRIGNANLLEAVVIQAPEGRAPFAVQHVDRFVSRLQPLAKCLLSRRAVVGRRLRLVVQLPAPYRRVVPVATRQFGNDSLAEVADR